MTPAARRGLTALAIAAAACGCDPRVVDLTPDRLRDAGTGAGEAIPQLRSLRITPDHRDARYDGEARGERVQFRAFGRFPSGERDVTDLVRWSLSRVALGTIEAGRFKASGVGGRADVIAQAGDVSAKATLRVQLDVRINRGVDDASLAAFDAADSGDVTGSAAPQLAYPPDGAILPANLAHMRYQWTAPAELDRFQVQIDSDDVRLRYYTPDRDWLDDAATSRFLAPSHPGASVRVRVRALSSARRDVVYRSSEAVLDVAADSVLGDALYWSTTARSLKRGNLSSNHATRVVTEPAGSGASTCTGCHALSRDGAHLAFADGSDRLWLFAGPAWTPQTFSSSMPTPPEPMMPGMPKGPKAPPVAAAGAPAMPPMPAMQPMAADAAMAPAMPMPGARNQPGLPRAPADYGWSSFNPDGSQLAYAAKGKLHIIDVATGQEVPKLHAPPDLAIAHPDWSPDGAFIAVAQSNGKAPKSDKTVRGSSIARLEVRADGMLGDPQILAASAGPDDTFAFPTYSPDGKFIAFSRTAGASKDNPTAQLWIVAADGSAPPVLLERASRPAGSDPLTPPAATNSMPVWVPQLGADGAFLAFSSTRDYGTQLRGVQRDQLWMSAIDFSALTAGQDPSAPPFWLPFQDPSESNHRALWSNAADGCTPSAELCDQRDDDCDGTVDESCCDPSPEDCSDDADNDCDGVANEGCGCALVEVCDNMQDDDCDEHVDEDCKE